MGDIGKRCRAALWVTAAFLCSGGASASTATWFSSINGFIVDDANYGGCMVSISPDAASQAGISDCAATWVSLDCAGGFGSKSDGQTKLSQAQLAWVTGKQIRVRANNLKKHNGYCVIERIDLFN